MATPLLKDDLRIIPGKLASYLIYHLKKVFLKIYKQHLSKNLNIRDPFYAIRLNSTESLSSTRRSAILSSASLQDAAVFLPTSSRA